MLAISENLLVNGIPQNFSKNCIAAKKFLNMFSTVASVM
jgi:hypothetical protein